jgi:hypothetical protein
MYFFDGENISFDAGLVIYINSTNIPPIMITNRIYEHQNLDVAVACFLPGVQEQFCLHLCMSNVTHCHVVWCLANSLHEAVNFNIRVN